MVFDKYRNMMVGSTCSKTLITQNPDTLEGQNLYKLSKRAQSKMNYVDNEDQNDDQSNWALLVRKAVNNIMLFYGGL